MLTALCFTAVLGISVASYIAICQQSLQSSTRTAYMNQAARLAEVGFEEALWHLTTARKNTAATAATAWGGWTKPVDAINNVEAYSGNADPSTSQIFREAKIDADDDDVGSGTDTSSDDATTTLTYNLGNGATGKVAIAVTNYQSTSVSAPPVIRVVAKISLSNGQAFYRKYRAATRRAPVFANAIASASSYVLFSNRGTVDSWNSDTATPSNGNYITNYSFTTGTTSNYAAVVAGSTGVYLDETHVFGYLATNGSNCSWDTGGVIHGWVKGPATASATEVDLTRVGKSAFVPLPDIITPTGASIDTIDDTNDSATYGTGLYDAEDLFIGTGENLVINGQVRIRVNHDFSVFGSGKITVNAGASLQIFVANNCWIMGAGIVTPSNNDPRKVSIFCTSPSTTSALVFETAEPFRGVIYSASRPVEINSSATFYGAILANSYVKSTDSTGTVDLHYDLNLRNATFTGVDSAVMLDRITEL